MTEKDTAILVVSFGSTHLDTLEKCIAATETYIGESFPGCPIFRAFLSRTVIARLKKKHDMHVDTVQEALAELIRKGYRQVIVQPTLLLGGIEYDLLVKKLEKETDIKTVAGRPLLENRADCEAIASVIMEENPLEEQEALLLMGHGTEHKANEVYGMLQDIFRERNYPCLIGTVESRPSFQDAVEELRRSGASHAKLLPLMFVAGDHAKNDMAGKEDSLLSLVEEAGIRATPIIRGLGESRKVQQLYGERVCAALEEIR